MQHLKYHVMGNKHDSILLKQLNALCDIKQCNSVYTSSTSCVQNNVWSSSLKSVFVKLLQLLVVPGLPCAHVLVAWENVRLPVIKVQKLLNLLVN